MSDPDTAETRLDGLEAVTDRLTTAATEQDICEVAVSAIPTLFDTDIGGIWLYDAEATELQHATATDRAMELFDVDVTYRPGNSLSWQAFESGEVYAYSGDHGDEQLYNTESLIESELIVPFGEYGVLNAASTQAEAFGKRDRQLARILSSNIESALTSAYREHELQVKKDRLEEVISIVSHDLRNPLEVASKYLEVCQEEDDYQYLHKVEDGLERIETLIEDLLALSEQGSVVDTRTSIDLEALAQRAWSNVYTPEATLRIAETIRIFGDEDRLLQVFENLFRNATEHCEPGVTIRVGPIQPLYTSTRVSPDEISGFYVEDDGPGIPAEKRDDVFDAGFSTDGTGLGLAIVDRIIEAHGWEIEVTEPVGGGTRFEITSGAKPVAPFEVG